LESFSAKNRTEQLQKLGNNYFDVLIIGGGITGAGIALDAAARGLRVALIEMQDFAAGTSSKSTKLIHGGLRYLKQLEFKLVAEVGKEREIIHNLAPHLTKPETMLLPIVKGGSLGKLTAQLAMFVYERLAGVKKEERYRALNKDETIATEPLLNKENLLSGILFYEYRTDDARLTIEVIKEAVSRGALAINYVKATGFIYQQEKISGVKTQDVLSNNVFDVKAKYIVNATGPWVDELDGLDKKSVGDKLKITKGVHIVVDYKKLPVKQSLYLDAVDKRMIFIIPREGKTYIGTTDTFYNNDKVHPTITQEDKEYLLVCANACFPNSQLAMSDIESSWAGLRPLISKPGKKASEISRKDEIFISDSGLMTIAGGKLTGYRKMAERIMTVIAKNFLRDEQISIAACSTHHIFISGGNLKGEGSFSEFLKRKINEGIELGLLAEEAERLVYRYGSNCDKVYEILNRLKNNNQIASNENALPLLIHAQLIYAINNEMCVTPGDFFIRRTGMIYFDIAAVKKYKQILLNEMKNNFAWTQELANKFDAELEDAIRGVIPE
jgi:glycerol-3-phosphate dehydrogenase